MNLSILICIIVLARRCDSGALKCSTDTDPLCRTEQESKDKPEQLSIDDVPDIQMESEVECLAGTEWESNCHFCRCSDSGVAECLRQDSCDQVIFTEPIRCQPGSTFKRDCHTCVCLDNGLGLCSLDACRTSVPKKSDLIQGRECAPGSKWMNQCNLCRCDDNGYGVCESEVCELQLNEPEKRCSPTTMWKNECNTCWCTSDGKPMCTKMGCVTTNYENEATEKIIEKEIDVPNKKPIKTNKFKRAVPCKPNEDFKSDCNLCKCSNSGQSYTCTQNECFEGEQNTDVEVFMETEDVDHTERHSVCKPLDSFYVSCNICHCNNFGTDYTCTDKPCPLPADVEVFHELKELRSSKNTTKAIVCVAKRMFIMDCNTCWCNEDGTSFYCTRRVCVPSFPEDGEGPEKLNQDANLQKRECKPNEKFQIDCNTCLCNSEGTFYSCTRIECIEPEKNHTLSRKVRASQQEPIKTCQPGQEFRLDCNKCLCDSEGTTFSCTRMDCDAINNNHNTEAFSNDRSKREVTQEKTTCVPGSVFDKGCNVCRCTDEGHHATCTLKRCYQKEEQVTQDPDPGFRCNPGEQFTRDCNDCTCSADGRTVFCTLRLCDHDITPDISVTQ